jgi:hypothetical protein
VDIEIYNNDGRRFRATLVLDGDAYGRNNVLTHLGAPMVEFYDLSFPEKFGDEGQFVTRYYVSTFLAVPPNAGLDLDAGVAAWRLDANALVQVRRWLATPELGEPADDWDADEPKYGPWLDQEF